MVELAVVAKKEVVVPAVSERVPKVVRPVTPSVPVKEPLPPLSVPMFAVLPLRVVEVAVEEVPDT